MLTCNLQYIFRTQAFRLSDNDAPGKQGDFVLYVVLVTGTSALQHFNTA